MNKNITSLKLQGATMFRGGGVVCSSCGESIGTPLLAMVFSESEVQEYYACPNCLSKVANIHEKPAKPENIEEAEDAINDAADAIEVEGNYVDKLERTTEVGDELIAEPVAAEISIKGDVKSPTGCKHQLGYLKNRGSNPIPEECLTCSKMIDCMY